MRLIMAISSVSLVKFPATRQISLLQWLKFYVYNGQNKLGYLFCVKIELYLNSDRGFFIVKLKYR